MLRGWLGETYGRGWDFGAAGIGSLAGLVVIRGLTQAHSLFLAIIPDFFEPSPVLLAMHTISACLLGGIL